MKNLHFTSIPVTENYAESIVVAYLSQAVTGADRHNIDIITVSQGLIFTGEHNTAVRAEIMKCFNLLVNLSPSADDAEKITGIFAQINAQRKAKSLPELDAVSLRELQVNAHIVNIPFIPQP
jgi:hypothetical protein